MRPNRSLSLGRLSLCLLLVAVLLISPLAVAAASGASQHSCLTFDGESIDFNADSADSKYTYVADGYPLTISHGGFLAASVPAGAEDAALTLTPMSGRYGSGSSKAQLDMAFTASGKPVAFSDVTLYAIDMDVSVQAQTQPLPTAFCLLTKFEGGAGDIHSQPLITLGQDAEGRVTVTATDETALSVSASFHLTVLIQVGMTEAGVADPGTATVGVWIDGAPLGTLERALPDEEAVLYGLRMQVASKAVKSDASSLILDNLAYGTVTAGSPEAERLSPLFTVGTGGARPSLTSARYPWYSAPVTQQPLYSLTGTDADGVGYTEAELRAALAAADDGACLTLLRELALSEPLTKNRGTATLSMGGYRLTAPSSQPALCLTESATLTLCGGGEGGLLLGARTLISAADAAQLTLESLTLLLTAEAATPALTLDGAARATVRSTEVYMQTSASLARLTGDTAAMSVTDTVGNYRMGQSAGATEGSVSLGTGNRAAGCDSGVGCLPGVAVVSAHMPYTRTFTVGEQTLTHSGVYAVATATAADTVYVTWCDTDGTPVGEPEAYLRGGNAVYQGDPALTAARNDGFLSSVFTGFSGEAEDLQGDVTLTATRRSQVDVRGMLQNLSLYAGFECNLYLPQSDCYTVYAGVDTVPLERTVASVRGQLYYVYQQGRRSNETAEPCVYRIEVTDASGAKLSARVTLSVLSYAEQVMASSSLSEADKRLVMYLMRYSTASYTYFDGEDAVPQRLSALLTDEGNAAYLTHITVPGESTSTITPASPFYGAWLDLNESPYFCFSMKDKSFRGRMRITYRDYRGRQSTHYYEVDASVSPVVVVDDLRLYHFDADLTVATQAAGETDFTEWGVYNLAAYIESVGKGNESLRALLAALTDAIEVSRAYKQAQ